MRPFFPFYATMIFCCVTGTALPQGQGAGPLKVYRRVYESHSQEWYREQARLWQEETRRAPTRAEAWYNLYMATEYGHQGGSHEDNKAALAAILADMQKALPASYEIAYLSSRLHQDRELELLERAHRLQPDNPEPLYGMISRNLLEGRHEVAKKYLHKLYETRDIAPGLLEYNYNVLMSVPQQGIVLTNGDNDTYPAWVLQTVKSIRQDVTVVNISMAQHAGYLDRLLNSAGVPVTLNGADVGQDKSRWVDDFVRAIAGQYSERPVCLAFTLEPGYFNKLEDSLFITGLVYQYSPTSRLDNIALLHKNVENGFRLDNLNQQWYGEFYPAWPSIKRLNANYVTPFLLLADHYRVSGDLKQSHYWRDLSFAIAGTAGNKELLQYIKTNY